MIKIEPLSAVNPSTYNPRTADPKRLDLIELSLRKLGFIAPIYADANGEILSGHQRHFVATRMGVKNVPVFRISPMELEKRKALNIVFNRATNDGDICQTPEKAKRILESLNLSELSKNIQDKELESRDFFRCAYRQVNGKAFHNESNAGNIAFRLEYESGVRIGDFQDKPKVQKYHTKKEFYKLFSPFFRNVQISEMTGNVNAKCENVRRIPWERLEDALRFEFNLPYPDGSRMGLVDEAISAFKHRYEILG